jgi:hypothetical protein
MIKITGQVVLHMLVLAGIMLCVVVLMHAITSCELKQSSYNYNIDPWAYEAKL